MVKFLKRFVKIILKELLRVVHIYSALTIVIFLLTLVAVLIKSKE